MVVYPENSVIPLQAVGETITNPHVLTRDCSAVMYALIELKISRL